MSEKPTPPKNRIMKEGDLDDGTEAIIYGVITFAVVITLLCVGASR